MLNPNYVSQRPIGKFASINDIKSSKVWYDNITNADKLKYDADRLNRLRQKYPKRSLFQNENENIPRNSIFNIRHY